MNVARLVLPALRWREETGFTHEETTLAGALALGVGGFIIFGGTARAVTELTGEIARRAGRPLLLAADLERGAGQQFAGLTEFPPPGALARLGLDAVRDAAATTAREARGAGLNWVFAPVADLDIEPENPIVQTRSFGSDPGAVAAAVAAWVTASQANGALACAKHYPGHGRATQDSHAGVPSLAGSRDQLLGQDGQPFEAAIHAGVAAVMTAHVASPALDATGTAATFSVPVLSHLRDALRFDGLIVTDAMIMEGAQRGGEGPAVDALRAGCDLLLYPPDPAVVVQAVSAALGRGALSEPGLARSLARRDRALAGVGPIPMAPLPFDPAVRSREMADALLASGLVRGTLSCADHGPSSSSMTTWAAPGHPARRS